MDKYFDGNFMYICRKEQQCTIGIVSKQFFWFFTTTCIYKEIGKFHCLSLALRYLALHCLFVIPMMYI